MNNDFLITDVGDDKVAVPVGESTQRFKGIIRMNDSAAFIMDKYLEGLSEERIAQEMLKEYSDIDHDNALRVTKEMIKDLKEKGILE